MRQCYVCLTTQNLHRHHVFGGANRNLSEKYGLVVDLCIYHHTGSNSAVHNNRRFDLALKKRHQNVFEETHTREEFISLFGRNYLED